MFTPEGEVRIETHGAEEGKTCIAFGTVKSDRSELYQQATTTKGTTRQG